MIRSGLLTLEREITTKEKRMNTVGQTDNENFILIQSIDEVSQYNEDYHETYNYYFIELLNGEPYKIYGAWYLVKNSPLIYITEL